MENQNEFKDNDVAEYMAQPVFYFYNLFLKKKEDKSFDWVDELDKIKLETESKSPSYQDHINYSIHLIKKEEQAESKLFFGFFIVGENEANYSKEKKGEFLELDLEEDEHLCHNVKGKLYFLICVDSKGHVILMLERQYFSLNINGFMNYFTERYSDSIEHLRSKNIIGKDLKSTIRNLKDNEIRLVRIYFKKYAPEDRVKKCGYVEDIIPNLLEKGIYADITLRWNVPPKTETFFKNFFKTNSFDEALDVDFGELLKIFQFKTDNDTIPTLNLLDKIICFTLPRDKAEYDDNEIFLSMKEGFQSKRDKLV